MCFNMHENYAHSPGRIFAFVVAVVSCPGGSSLRDVFPSAEKARAEEEGGGRKIKEGKRRKDAESQAGPHPQVPWFKVCRVGGTGKYVSGGMWGGVAGGAKVVRCSDDPLQVAVEG